MLATTLFFDTCVLCCQEKNRRFKLSEYPLFNDAKNASSYKVNCFSDKPINCWSGTMES
jgi:hypothetical protein